MFDDTVLNLLDDFMLDAKAHNIKVRIHIMILRADADWPKLMISMHSFNALSAGDVYGALYGTGFFYEWANATSQFDNRLRHVMNHVHTSLNQPWKELSDYIFAFEAENEAMIGKVSTIHYTHGFSILMIVRIGSGIHRGPSILVMRISIC